MNHEITGRRLNIYGDILTQTYLDVRYKNESKIIVNSELQIRYTWLPILNLLGEYNHFQKSFYGHSRSFLWSEYGSYLQCVPTRRFSAWLGYRLRTTTFTVVDKIRFREENLEVKGKYKFTNRISLEGALIRSGTIYKDYYAMTVFNDTLLIPLDYYQIDKGVEGLMHVRFQGKIICGIQAGMESVSSNSVIGEYDQIRLRAYLSGYWRQSTFYHIVFQRVNKVYRNPVLEGVSIYRDPEEPTQNRTYMRLEKILKKNGIGYLQITLLQNETIVNQQYYNKTLIELGLQYEL